MSRRQRRRRHRGGEQPLTALGPQTGDPLAPLEQSPQCRSPITTLAAALGIHAFASVPATLPNETGAPLKRGRPPLGCYGDPGREDHPAPFPTGPRRRNPRTGPVQCRLPASGLSRGIPSGDRRRVTRDLGPAALAQCGELRARWQLLAVPRRGSVDRHRSPIPQAPIQRRRGGLCRSGRILLCVSRARNPGKPLPRRLRTHPPVRFGQQRAVVPGQSALGARLVRGAVTGRTAVAGPLAPIRRPAEGGLDNRVPRR